MYMPPEDRQTEPIAKLCFYMRNEGQWTALLIIALNVIH